MNRRAFFGLLAAAPIAAVAVMRATPRASVPMKLGDGMLGLVDNGTIADSYAGISRMDHHYDAARYFMLAHRIDAGHPDRSRLVDGIR